MRAILVDPPNAPLVATTVPDPEPPPHGAVVELGEALRELKRFATVGLTLPRPGRT